MKKIICSNGDKIMVDDDLYPFLSRFSWSTRGKAPFTKYAFTNIIIGKRRTSIEMHRMIMRFSSALVDHKDGNGLNNQIENLRYCNHSQNMSNSKKRKSASGYRGVVKDYNGAEGWTARIIKNGKIHYIGYFKSPQEAAIAYDKKALALKGEFAVLNFPRENYL